MKQAMQAAEQELRMKNKTDLDRVWVDVTEAFENVLLTAAAESLGETETANMLIEAILSNGVPHVAINF